MKHQLARVRLIPVPDARREQRMKRGAPASFELKLLIVEIRLGAGTEPSMRKKNDQPVYNVEM